MEGVQHVQHMLLYGSHSGRSTLSLAVFQDLFVACGSNRHFTTKLNQRSSGAFWPKSRNLQNQIPKWDKLLEEPQN